MNAARRPSLAGSERIDLTWAEDDYLWQGGHLRRLQHLHDLVRDAEALDATILWEERAGLLGCCDLRRRIIRLAPWLFWSDSWYFRRVLSHELGHLAAGFDEERVRCWQQLHYAELIDPE